MVDSVALVRDTRERSRRSLAQAASHPRIECGEIPKWNAERSHLSCSGYKGNVSLEENSKNRLPPNVKMATGLFRPINQVVETALSKSTRM